MYKPSASLNNTINYEKEKNDIWSIGIDGISSDNQGWIVND